MTIHKKLNKLLVENLNEVLAMYNRGVRLTFTDLNNNSDYLQKARKHGHFTGYKN